MIQFCLKEGSPQARATVAAEVRAHAGELAKSKYGHYLVVKMINVAPKSEVPGEREGESKGRRGRDVGDGMDRVWLGGGFGVSVRVCVVLSPLVCSLQRRVCWCGRSARDALQYCVILPSAACHCAGVGCGQKIVLRLNFLTHHEPRALTERGGRCVLCAVVSGCVMWWLPMRVHLMLAGRDVKLDRRHPRALLSHDSAQTDRRAMSHQSPSSVGAWSFRGCTFHPSILPLTISYNTLPSHLPLHILSPPSPTLPPTPNPHP